MAVLVQGDTIMGASSFLSPEPAGRQPSGAANDLHSLGVVLYCLCTGRKPLQGSNKEPMTAALDTLRPVHELNPAIPAALSDLVMQLLASNPAHRPASAEAVLEQIRQIEACLSDSSFPHAPSPAGSVLLSRGLSGANFSRLLSSLFWTRALLAVGVGLLVLVAGILLTRTAGLRTHDPPVSLAAPGIVFLSKMEVIEPVNWPLKRRLPGRPVRKEPAYWPAPIGGYRVCVGGRVSLHGIWMHLPGPDGGTVSVSYHLNKRFRAFDAAVSLNDGPPKCTPLTFAVYGDGRLLWKSEPVRIQADEQSCKALSVKGVDKLTLEVSGSGKPRGTHAVWIEPYLSE